MAGLIDLPIVHFAFAIVTYLLFEYAWKHMLKNKVGYKWLSKPSPSRHWDLVDCITAIVYVTITMIWLTLWSLLCEDVLSDLFFRYNTYHAYFIAFTLGRFIHHTVITYRERGLALPSMLTHHVLFSAYMVGNLWTQTGQGSVLVALWMEFGNLSLSIRPVLILTGNADGILFEANKYCLLLTMIVSRVASLGYTGYIYVTQYQSIPDPMFTILGMGLSFITPYSIFLLFKLIHRDFFVEHNIEKSTKGYKA